MADRPESRRISQQGERPIRLPALCFSQDGLLCALDSLDRIIRCTKRGFKTGFYKGLLLIDSNAERFRVADARRVRTLPPRRCRDLVELFSGNLRWQVELIFEPGSSNVSLAEVKRLIASSWERTRRSGKR